MLYRITADYRPNNVCKPRYYVSAKNKTEAKKILLSYLPYMKVYDIYEMSAEETKIHKEKCKELKAFILGIDNLVDLSKV